MKCEEVQSHFSDYLDKTAEGPRAKGIENHLSNCPICSEEFAGLLECRQLLSSLPEIEPPVGFTMRVMAHVAEAANETSFWKHLFIPLKIRLPLQATAVMLIGILSFYVYERADYSKAPPRAVLQNSSPIADEVTATATPSGADQAVPVEQVEKSIPPKGATTEKQVEKSIPPKGATTEKQVEKSIPQTASVPKSATTEKATPSTRPIPAATVSDTPPEGTAGSRRSFPIQAQGVVAGPGVAGPIGVPRQPPFRLFPTERELVNLGEPIADYELLVRVGARRARDIEGTANSAEKSAGPKSSSSGAEGSRLMDLQASSVLNILWYTVPRDQYEQFKNELAAQARIESEIPIGIRDKAWSFRSDGPLFIKVVVLAPSE